MKIPNDFGSLIWFQKATFQYVKMDSIAPLNMNLSHVQRSLWIADAKAKA